MAANAGTELHQNGLEHNELERPPSARDGTAVRNRVRTNSSSSSGASNARIVVLSSKTRQSALLNSSLRSGVQIVPYIHDNTSSLESLFQLIEQTTASKKFESVSFIANGQPGTLQLCSNSDQVRESFNLFSKLDHNLNCFGAI